MHQISPECKFLVIGQNIQTVFSKLFYVYLEIYSFLCSNLLTQFLSINTNQYLFVVPLGTKKNLYISNFVFCCMRKAKLLPKSYHVFLIKVQI